jgi:hypothetical protein
MTLNFVVVPKLSAAEYDLNFPAKLIAKIQRAEGGARDDNSMNDEGGFLCPPRPLW